MTHRISMLGVPYDGGSTFARGAALGPPAIREALASDSSNLWTEDGVDLGGSDILHDLGDLEVPSDDRDAVFDCIREGVARAAHSGEPVICLGGDHSITYPIVRGLAAADLTILHFDAHPDLYRDYRGRLSHACQFARVMEERLARRLIQVGIRTMNGEQREQARRFGVEVISMRRLDALARLTIEGPVYISFDLDALDPAFAPAVSHLEPGGLSVREVLTMLQSVRASVVGADIVELNPQREGARRTAMVAAKVLKEIAAAMLRDGAEPQPGWV
jgi:agmatinase